MAQCSDCLQPRRASRGRYRLNPASPRARALRLLSFFVLTPLELAAHLGITSEHAAITLRRLAEQGYCRRFHSGKLYNGRAALRYRLRDR